MRNVFLLYMAPSNHQAMVHYQDTIKSPVSLDRLSPFISKGLRAQLLRIFGPARIAVWGSRAGPKNLGNFENMAPGDDVIIVEGDTVRLIGKVAEKTRNPELSRELWKSLKGADETP